MDRGADRAIGVGIVDGVLRRGGLGGDPLGGEPRGAANSLKMNMSERENELQRHCCER